MTLVSNNCHDCGTDVETMQHLFYDYSFVSNYGVGLTGAFVVASS